ncbi:DUF4424 family protein [Mangrovibacterium diazotrophicum]|uniref:Uncharacterized protein DUF4424 n=1 Tax=Mangrovibacterium diazotrophicum TaxID=1261403 RepID=A0A419W402_9BACT|nr:DUF4424 family protein [Mangrovibacterium diazotrophicum]RKD90179.1 uncharacterized protein DUF4424 [Mangrovibacterium diazotrophicum]
MKTTKIILAILALICLQTSLFADIAPNPIKAKSISPKAATSIRMESERVEIDLYNDSSVVTCVFYMRNLGEPEKLQIGFPDMRFYHFSMEKHQNGDRFAVKENGKTIAFTSASGGAEGSGSPDEKDWYLWNSEFEKGESKTIEVQYSLPCGMRYKSNERFFTYLLSTGAGWEGTIGKAEIIVNLKDIEQDSVLSQTPANCEISGKQFSWTFTDFEPTENNDIKISYNTNKNVYKGPKPINPTIFIDGVKADSLDLNTVQPNDIACIQVFKTTAENNLFPESPGGVVKIYSKVYVWTKLDKMVKAKSKKKINLPDYDALKENYSLFVDDNEVDFSEVIGIKEEFIAKLEVIKSRKSKRKIMIGLR